MSLELTTPPSAYLIGLADAKAQLRIDQNDTEFDAYLTSLCQAADELITAETGGRIYTSRAFSWSRESWAPLPMRLPVAPNYGPSKASVSSVQYASTANDGTMLTLDPSQYWVSGKGATLEIRPRWGAVLPLIGDAPDGVVIAFAFALDGVPVPAKVVHCGRMLVSYWFNYQDAVAGINGRDSSNEPPFSVHDMLFSETWK